MHEITLDLNHPVIRGLACAALAPPLRCVLIYDVPSAELRWVARAAELLVEAVDGVMPKSATLGVSETDDDLWGQFVPGTMIDQWPKLVWQHGLVTGNRDVAAPHVIVIPDLTRISLATARAAVALMGAEVAHLERHGQQQHWQPNLFWIAGCPGELSAIGHISPHLLDRFALRLNWEPVEQESDRVSDILHWSSQTRDRSDVPARLSDAVRKKIRTSAQQRPVVPERVISYLLSYFPRSTNPSSRRVLAVMRLAIANAQLVGSESLSTTHIDAAARIINLAKADRPMPGGIPHVSAPRPMNEMNDLPPPKPVTITSTAPSAPPQPSVVQPPPQETTVFKSDTIDIMPAVTVAGDPYREDTAPVRREIASLQLPTYQVGLTSTGRGPVIGVRSATNLHDLAIVSSILEAAKVQPARQRLRPDLASHFRLFPPDLRSYRRAPVADRMLAVAIDHTCLRNWDYMALLRPYLEWAYVERASICLIQIGAAQNRNAFQAELLLGRKLFDPQILAGLQPQPGRATPLAHGLDLTLSTLQHALQHGRSTIREAVLIVISDGRGNVPLSVSRGESPPKPVIREGIEDALRVAQQLRTLERVRTLLISPHLRIYTQLPIELAKTLGGLIIQAPNPSEHPGD